MMRAFTHSALAFLVFLALTGIRTWPLLARFRTHIPSDPYEPLLMTWVLAWDTHALITNPLGLFDANILYPAKRVLAFSEHLLGLVPIFGPVYLLTGSPVAGYNVVFFLSFALSGFAMFALSYYLTRVFWSAMVAGTLFAFASARLLHIGHLHLLSFFWAPLAFVFLDRFLKARRWRDLSVFAGLYWLQVLSSVYLGYMTTIGLALYVVAYLLWVDRGVLEVRLLPKVLAFVSASLLVLVPIHRPYFEVSEEWGISRDMDKYVSSGTHVLLSAEPLNYLATHRLMADTYHGVLRALFPVAEAVGDHEKWLFPGLLLPALVLVGSWSRLESVSPEGVRRARRAFWLVLVAAVVLSLGPFLVVLKQNTGIPLPYLLLFHTIPGFRAIRAPARFVFLAALAASVLATLGAAKLCEVGAWFARERRLARLVRPVVSGGLILLALLELGLRPFPLAKVPTGQEVPAVYRWLAEKGRGVVVEVPKGAIQEYEYTYYSTFHWLPLVNGASGYLPPSYLEIDEMVQALPSRRAVGYVRGLGVKWIILHRSKLRPEELEQWNGEKTEGVGLRKIHEVGPDVVFEVVPETVASQLPVAPDMPGLHPAACDSLDDMPRVTWGKMRMHLSTDRPSYPRGEARADLLWTAGNLGETWTADVYLALRGPDGPACRLFFIEFGRQAVLYRGGLRPIFLRGIMVPTRHGGPSARLHSLPLAGLPPGVYTVHLLFAKATGNQIVAEARALFRVEP